MKTYTGPCKMECPMNCDVPDGVKLAEVPRPRHQWGDVLACPNGKEVECERAFLVVPKTGE